MALATEPRFSSGTAQLCRHWCGGMACPRVARRGPRRPGGDGAPVSPGIGEAVSPPLGASRKSRAERGQQVVTKPRFRPALPGLCHHEGYLASTDEELASFQNAKREKLQNPNVTFFMRGRGALRGESGCHGVHRLPFPPTVPRRHPAPPAAAGRVPRSPPARRRSAPSPVGPSPPAPCGPFQPAPGPGCPRRRSRPVRPRAAPCAGRSPGPERGPPVDSRAPIPAR
jgi:hypothetical protein